MKNNQIQHFRSDEFGLLEILTIDGKPYFPATECAKVLGYSNTKDAIIRHCKGVVKHDSLTIGGNQSKNYIPEGDLYRLIIRSKLPAAERFERWVFDEVLPSIRKFGAYAAPSTLDEMLRSPEFADTLIRQLDRERKKNDALEELAAETLPKAIYCDIVLQSRNAIPVSLIAKDYGMTAARFNRLLHDLRIQFKVGGAWLLYQPFAGKGYVRTQTYQVSETTSATHTRWTQKGRLFLYERLKEYGIVPVMERKNDNAAYGRCFS
ncbi:MAG: phage antirepressor KilAC domain-containing protein [Oscillospiraceae bacterium]|nr:phage antirepressor KilAC domain-containing protein [Oscillospiraceae bacterium]